MAANEMKPFALVEIDPDQGATGRKIFFCSETCAIVFDDKMMDSGFEEADRCEALPAEVPAGATCAMCQIPLGGGETREHKIRAAIRVLTRAANEPPILRFDDIRNVHLIIGIVAPEDGREHQIGDGVIEYQVSDGPPGTRDTSFDLYTMEEALRVFDEVVRVGWRNYGKDRAS